MQKSEWHAMEIPHCLEMLETTPSGLSEQEAAARQGKYGKNELHVGESVSWLTLFLNQFKDFMVLVLLAATLVSGLLGEFTDAITIIAIIIVNGILGFLQEVRAERSLASLKQLTAPEAHVLRSGEKTRIKASELVPGDIIFLEAGDRVPADVRLIQVSSLEVEESSLTGESLPVSKFVDPLEFSDVSLGDRRNMAFMGTMVTRGKAQAIVVETGMQTEMGLIADLIANSDETETPLQRRLEQLGKILVYVSLLITVIVVVTGYMHGHELGEMFLAGVSLAVAAIPEGLPAIVTIALALGVQRMIRRRAIVRKLPSVETLGCATVICSDKTGTLTQNRMTVQRIYQGGRFYQVTGTGYSPVGEIIAQETGSAVRVRSLPDLARLLEMAVLCNNAQLQEAVSADGASEWTAVGDPTEAALLVLAQKAQLDPDKLDELEKRMDEIPFDSDRKMMSVVTRKGTGELFLLTKGAPDIVLDRCTHFLSDGKPVPLSAALRRTIARANDAMGEEALRNLAFAYKVVPDLNVAGLADPEQGLVFVGLVGMIDPPRPEVFEAVQKCRHAGIRTVMITGDHQVTAESIARQLGILPAGGAVLTGADISVMNPEELIKRVDKTYVYARVSPENKLQIVKALQARGHVVAMTGDGVNDAPAIKSADIGIAMGRGGTDVAKEASALILSDDNFATIVAAIEEGRAIYDNIRKFIRYLLASNVGEIVTMFAAMLIGLPLPLLPIQILWVNLVTDGLPAIALGVDTPEDDIMRKPPRSVKESIFARGLGRKIVSRGILIGLMTLAVFMHGLKLYPDNLLHAQTMAFATLVMAQLIHVFDCRSVENGILSRNILGNVWLLLSVISSIVLMAAALYVPFMEPIFKTYPLNFTDWGVVLIGSAVPTFVFAARRKKRASRTMPAWK